MEDAQRKANTHIVLNFDQCNTLFLVQETINPREVRLTENFMVKLDKRWCDYGKFQKLHMPCSNVGVALGKLLRRRLFVGLWHQLSRGRGPDTYSLNIALPSNTSSPRVPPHATRLLGHGNKR
ncbi:hypothetical protein JHK82_055466 [Glycine max]|nr:hypothetical protein JHK82_055466 [Glycine max]